MQDNDNRSASRRQFLGALAATAATLGASSLAPLSVHAKTLSDSLPLDDTDPEAFLKGLNGKHKMVFDVTEPHDVFPFAWPRVFLLTNEMTGDKAPDTNCVVVLRHAAIPYALRDNLWTKYNFAEVFHVTNPGTKENAVRNAFWQPAAGTFKVPGIGPVAIGINELQESGVRFVVCNMALTVFSAAVADKMKMDPQTVKQEWLSGVLPNIQVVPSGVWAVGRAQDKGFGYCFVR